MINWQNLKIATTRVCLFYTILGILLILVPITFLGFNYYFGADSFGPRDGAELCIELGRDPDKDPLCTFRSIGDLLNDEFKIGETTIDEVNRKIGRYFISSNERSIGGTRETYAIMRQFCCLQPFVYMTYDEEGVLTNFTLYD